MPSASSPATAPDPPAAWELSIERQSTIGQQRLHNHACQPMSQEEFVALVTAGQPAAPEYFRAYGRWAGAATDRAVTSLPRR